MSVSDAVALITSCYTTAWQAVLLVLSPSDVVCGGSVAAGLAAPGPQREPLTKPPARAGDHCNDGAEYCTVGRV